MKKSPVLYGILVGLIVVPLTVLVLAFCNHGWQRAAGDFGMGYIAFALMGAVWGAIAGACFKGEENRGAIIFAILCGVAFAIDKGIDVYAKAGILKAVGESLVRGVAYIVVGAIFGRLVVANVKWVNREIGFAIRGSTGQAVFGGLVGAICAVCLIAAFLAMRASDESIDTMTVWLRPAALISFKDHFIAALTGTIGPTLFGLVPVALAAGIAGAAAGARTPRPSESEVERETVT